MKKRLFSLAVVFALVVSMMVPMASAAPEQVNTLEEFLAAECDHFVRGVDTNSYTHSMESFPSNYALSDEYIGQLIALEPLNSRKLQFIEFRDSGWGGSCYGIASTMILNRLTKDNKQAENGGLYIDHFQEGAENYYDLDIPMHNPPVLDMINYYMLSQLLSWSDNFTDMLVVGDLTETGATHEEIEEAVRQIYGDGVVSAEDFVEKVKYYVDQDMPFLFCFFCSAGGHAIVGVDYFEDDNGTPADPSDDVFYLKTYDENDVLEWGQTDPCWSYLAIPKGADGAYDTDAATLNYMDYESGEYGPVDGLFLVSIYEMDQMNRYLNIENPVKGAFATTYYPIMTVEDMGRVHDQISIQVLSDKYDTSITFKDFSGIPMPQYSNAQGKDALHAFHYNAAIQNQMRASLVFDYADRFVVTNSGSGSLDIGMSREEQEGFGGYTSVTASSFKQVEFDGDGQFQKIEAQPGQSIEDLTLYVGTLGDEFSADMFSIHMPSCTYLEMYDGLDEYSYGDAIVLHSDGFTEGMDMLFYQGLDVIDEPLSVYADDERDRWIKVKSDNLGGTSFISIWSAFEPEEGGFPVFRDQPDMTGWVGETPEDGWVPLVSGDFIYLEDGELVTGPIHLITNVEEHTFLLDEYGYLVTGAVEVDGGYDYYSEDGTSPNYDGLGQLVYSVRTDEAGMTLTLVDWVIGSSALIFDETLGDLAIIDNGDGTMTVMDEEFEPLECIANADGTFSMQINGIDVTLVIDPNQYTITSIYSDVPANAWYAGTVKYCYTNDLLPGVSEGLFGPNQPMSRGDMVLALYRMLGAAFEETEGSVAFEDVAADGEYYEAVKWAVNSGIVAAESESVFGLSQPVTREQVVVALFEAMKGLDLDPEGETDLSQYEDADQISEEARDAMAWAVEYGMIYGRDDSHLVPTDTASRVEGLTILQNSIIYLLLAMLGLL